MEYSRIAEAYERIERTTGRLEMTEFLVDLFKQTPKAVLPKVVYLTQGKLYPDYVGVEVGVAEKLAIRAVAQAAGVSEAEVQKQLHSLGDLGEATMRLMEGHRPKGERLTVQDVYSTLDEMAKASGAGSQERKISLLRDLLRRASPKEAKYIVRTVTGKLRLGVGDMTVLDALAVALAGDKKARVDLERAYNLSSDLGLVAETLVKGGIEEVRKFHVSVGHPIRPMLAERLASPVEILQKLGGRCIAEYKYDGERVQVHKRGKEVVLYSRRLENITAQYPDAIELVQAHVKAKDAIIECEAVAIDPDTGELRPFQELMHRRRKYGIREAMELYPISLFAFEALYVDGQDLTVKSYEERHRMLEKIIEPSDRFRIAEYLITDDPEELELFFERAIQDGCEGVICKAVHPKAVYQAGARGWLWIKYKRDYKSEMTDTVDLVVVGAFYGRGRRGGTYGALLLAAYDPIADVFRSVTKCGSGFSDEDLEQLPKRLKPYTLEHRHPRVDSKMEADVWFTPGMVIEVIGAEITLSPTHTCGWGAIRPNAGLAIRFPRFTGRYRDDKSPEDATTCEEIISMYQRQLKTVAVS